MFGGAGDDRHAADAWPGGGGTVAGRWREGSGDVRSAAGAVGGAEGPNQGDDPTDEAPAEEQVERAKGHHIPVLAAPGDEGRGEIQERQEPDADGREPIPCDESGDALAMPAPPGRQEQTKGSDCAQGDDSPEPGGRRWIGCRFRGVSHRGERLPDAGSGVSCSRSACLESGLDC